MKQSTAAMKRRQQKAYPYCGSCNACLSISPVNDLLVGRRFICPKWSWSFPHVGTVVSSEDRLVHCWLRFQHCLVRYATCYTMEALIRRAIKISLPPEMILVIYGTILLLSLVLLVSCPGLLHYSAFLPAAYYIFDALVYTTSVAFITQQPRAPLRSAILGGFAFLNLSFAFAVLYSLLPKEEIHPELNWLTALYFSLVTIVTLGYGDIRPSPSARLAPYLVILEIVVGLYFLSMLLAIIVSWANVSEALPTLKRLLAESDRLDKEEEL